MTASLRVASTTGSEGSNAGLTVPNAGASSYAYCCAPGNGSAAAWVDMPTSVAATAHTAKQPDTTCLNAIPETPPAFGLAAG